MFYNIFFFISLSAVAATNDTEICTDACSGPLAQKKERGYDTYI